MPLVIENGTGIAGANSYCDVDELRTFAGDRGVAFPIAASPDTANIAIFTPYLIRSCDYLESLRGQFLGWESSDTQSLAWPRKGVVVNRSDILNWGVGSIPLKLKQAQLQLCLEQMRGISLAPTQAGLGVGSIPDGVAGPVALADTKFLVRSKIDVIEDEWSQQIGTQSQPIMPAVDALLRPLLINGSTGFMVGVRI